jgi:hypothetical protein
MQTQSEAPAGPIRERARWSTAFGLSLAVDPRIDIPGIPNLDGAGVSGLDASPSEGPISALASQPPTRVRFDPAELERRWRGAESIPERVRELRDDGETVLLSVELARPAGYLLHAPGFGRILVAPDGTELLCDPEPGGAEWSTLLPAQALPLAATLQGFEVLHASGVVPAEGAVGGVLGGGAALFAGPQGTGKSSLAAALLRRGATLLSDDTVALEQRGGTLIAHPGAALLQLRSVEHERLSAQARAVLGTPEMFLGKQRYSPGVSTSPAPFGALFLLERSTHGPSVECIEAVDPFALLASTFNLSVRTPERLTRHLDLAVALAATKRVYRLRVQPGMDATQLADTLYERLPEL